MKKPFLSVLCITGLMSLLFITSQTAIADIYSQFHTVSTANWRWAPGQTSDYSLPDSLQAKLIVLRDGTRTPSNPTGLNDFKKSFITSNADDIDLDDGYARIPLGFSYNFDGFNYDHIYVSINGFATFGTQVSNGQTPPTYTPAPPPYASAVTANREGLFRYDANMPVNVLAPFWGDHKYWTTDDTLNAKRDADHTKYLKDDMTPSEIGYVNYIVEVEVPDSTVTPPAMTTVPINVCLIQWKNINVNWRTQGSWNPVRGDYDYTWSTGNVANFQLVIFEGINPAQEKKQGDVQFRYGTVASYLYPNAAVSDDWFYGAVGAKGSASRGYGLGDFINALYNGNGPDAFSWPDSRELQQTSMKADRLWAPSGDPTRAILLAANPWSGGDESWGDGDADMSRINPDRPSHYQSNDTRKFVTVSDALAILRSVTSPDRRLDSAYKQAAFHGDVHHDGRYYFLGNELAALYRAEILAAGGNRLISDNENWAGGRSGDEADNFMSEQANVSKDTFYLRKVTELTGEFGFLPKWGKNDDYISIDLRKAIIAAGLNAANATYPDYRLSQGNTTRYRVNMNNTIKRFIVAGPATDDYFLKIALENPTDADRSLIWYLTKKVRQATNQFAFKLRKNVWWRDSTLNDTGHLPNILDYTRELFWEANELDASFIRSYLGGKIPKLPWWDENVEHNDKDKSNVVPYRLADNIAFDNVEYNADNIVIPVYYNGVALTNQAVRFSYNCDINDIVPANADVMVSYDNASRTAAIISDGHFNTFTPVAYIHVANNVTENVTDFNASTVRFYGQRAANVTCKLNKGVAAAATDLLGQNYPNPASVSTNFMVNIPVTGNYKLTITDINGALVKVIADGTFAAGERDFGWNLTNASNEQVQNGTYFYTLEGDNIALTKSLVIAK